MKISLSSIPPSAGSIFIRPALVLLLLLFLSFVSSANCRHQKTQSPTLPRIGHYCSSFSHENSRSLCIELQRLHHRLRPFPPFADPRYAAEKRLVPTGPNPLHN